MKLCLVVDSSKIVVDVAKCLLNSMGYEVISAGTGEEGIQRCQLQMPDAILLDWDLPDMSGFDFLIEFKKSFRVDPPHIVYMTTENDPIDISRSLSSGASDFVLKPFDRSDIQAKFQNAARVDA